MINIRLARAVFLAMLACLIMLIGAGWSENSGPPSLEETLQSGIAGFAANAEAPSVDELSAAEQEALLQEVMSNLWRYEASPDSPRPMPRATDARNGLIVFVNENGRLSQANPDGSGAIVIQNTIENANSPQWSPDETRIAFVGDKQGSTGRCIYILRHSDRQLSTVTCEPAIIQDPHWSSDGQSLAFFGHMSEGDARKAGWVVSANGGSLKEIAPSLLNIWTPKWIDHDTVLPGQAADRRGPRPSRAPVPVPRHPPGPCRLPPVPAAPRRPSESTAQVDSTAAGARSLVGIDRGVPCRGASGTGGAAPGVGRRGTALVLQRTPADHRSR